MLLWVFSTPIQALALDKEGNNHKSKASKNQPWTFWKQNRNLRLEYREVAQHNLIEIHAKAKITSSLSAALLFLQDTTTIPNWLANASKSKILLKISDQENISKTTFDAFWPITKREMIIRSRYWQNDDLSVEVVIEDENKNYQQFSTTNTVAINILSAYWKIVPSSDNTLSIEHTIIANPNGAIPNWLANRIALRSMWQTLLNIEEQLPNSPFQQQHLPSIKQHSVIN